MKKWIAFMALGLTACGSLERQVAAVNPGDTQAAVTAAMGAPGDRQFNGNIEVWQYCQTGAGFGYHDFRQVWFRDGRVVSVSSYKDHSAAMSCSGNFRPVDWSAVQ